MSLKLKLMVVLVGLSTLIVGTYAYMFLQQFEGDKIGFIYEASGAQARSVSASLRNELDFVTEKVRFLIRGYDYANGQMHPYSQSIFAQENRFKALQVYQLDQTTGLYVEKNRLGRLEGKDVSPQANLAFVQEALQNHISIRLTTQDAGYSIAFKLEAGADQEPLVVVVEVNRGTFVENFAIPSSQDLFLLDGSGKVLLQSLRPTYQLNDATKSFLFLKVLENLRSTLSTRQVDGPTGSKYLVSVARVGLGDLAVLSLIPRDQALAALTQLMTRSIYFLSFLFCISLMVSVLSANQLTSSLKRLINAMGSIGQGNFDVQVPVTNKDEIGELSKGFNLMTGEIQRLLSETQEKARMEGELQTAKTVQSTLFPPTTFQGGGIQINGFYTPASECGGDWWSYQQIGNIFYLMIGDATGHGVPAALVTSAIRSASAVLEHFPEFPLERTMGLLNKAINATSRGQVNMTFFLAKFDPATGDLAYCNASHEPPFHFLDKDGQVNKGDMQVLLESPGPRLGESPDSEYTTTNIKLNVGDRLVFYTDGVTELKDPSEKLWGERRFIQALLEGFNANPDMSTAIDILQNKMTEFRKAEPLHDDVTYFLFKYDKVA